MGEGIADPIGTLALKSREKSEIEKDGLSGVEFIDKGKYLDEIKAAAVIDKTGFSTEDFGERMQGITNLLIQKHKKRAGSKNVVYIIVTHAPVVNDTFVRI